MRSQAQRRAACGDAAPPCSLRSAPSEPAGAGCRWCCWTSGTKPITIQSLKLGWFYAEVYKGGFTGY